MPKDQPTTTNPKFLYGTPLRDKIVASLQKSLKESLNKEEDKPSLAIIRVGEDPASAVYVRHKLKTAAEIGFAAKEHTLSAKATQKELEELVESLNQDPKVHGIICQFPLPKGLDEDRITRLVHPLKDVDCFHPENVGLLCLGQPRFAPCTPAGIMHLLQEAKVPLSGKQAVVLGRSNIVGRPMALLLGQKGIDATVTMAHSRSKDLPSFTKRADLLVVAVGQPQYLTADMVKEGAVVIDVGIHRLEKRGEKQTGGKATLVGDVDREAVLPKVKALTPVPGGVGPLTVACLMQNTLRAFQLQKTLKGV